MKRTEEKNGPADLTDSDINAAHVVPKHNVDDGRTSSALDEKPDQDNVSDQSEALMNSMQELRATSKIVLICLMLCRG